MPNSARSSSGSLRCHIEWHPSRWLCAALVALSLLAAFAVIVSEMPRPVAWPLALAAVAYGLVQAARYGVQARRELVFTGPDGPVMIDGRQVAGASVSWRGPLAFLRWTDAAGRTQRVAWWPDTLRAAGRRELRLAAPVRRAAPAGASVAP